MGGVGDWAEWICRMVQTDGSLLYPPGRSNVGEAERDWQGGLQQAAITPVTNGGHGIGRSCQVSRASPTATRTRFIVIGPRTWLMAITATTMVTNVPPQSGNLRRTSRARPRLTPAWVM